MDIAAVLQPQDWGRGEKAKRVNGEKEKKRLLFFIHFAI